MKKTNYNDMEAHWREDADEEEDASEAMTEDSDINSGGRASGYGGDNDEGLGGSVHESWLQKVTHQYCCKDPYKGSISISDRVSHLSNIFILIRNTFCK